MSKARLLDLFSFDFHLAYLSAFFILTFIYNFFRRFKNADMPILQNSDKFSDVKIRIFHKRDSLDFPSNLKLTAKNVEECLE